MKMNYAYMSRIADEIIEDYQQQLQQSDTNSEVLKERIKVLEETKKLYREKILCNIMCDNIIDEEEDALAYTE